MRLKEGGRVLPEKRGQCVLFSVVLAPSPQGVLPWLVLWACRAGTEIFPALAALVALSQDLKKDSATLTGWRRSQQSGEGKMIPLLDPDIYTPK